MHDIVRHQAESKTLGEDEEQVVRKVARAASADNDVHNNDNDTDNGQLCWPTSFPIPTPIPQPSPHSVSLIGRTAKAFARNHMRNPS
ncbi:hypothetical protein ACLKA6_012252 [Drosophila palustris]